jgi:hypothetical protein
VPAASVPIDFYRQGATLNLASDTTIDAETWVSVFNVGEVANNDILLVDGKTGLEVRVTADPVSDPLFPTQDKIRIEKVGGAAVPVGKNSRLIPRDKGAKPYEDPTGMAAYVGGSRVTTDGTGRASIYVANYVYDYVVRVPGEDPRVYIDQEGSFVMR